MSDESTPATRRVWLFAAGYFASYVPYALLTKALSSGALTDQPWSGTSILPLATAVSAIAMVVVVTWLGWWRYAAHTVRAPRIPRPRLVTFASGIATAVIVLTTTLAYAFDGVSVLFAMLLMRGGVLVLAPIVDRLTGRTFRSIRWWSWVGSGLALVALVVAFLGDGDAELSGAAAIDVALYLGAYFFRLRWMSLHAKSDGPDGRARRIAFFVEEQMVATPVALVGLAVIALLPGTFAGELRDGFVAIWPHLGATLFIILIGLCSQGTGVFGALVLLEPQENAFTVPVNRASSVLAGVVASLALVALGRAWPSLYELLGAACLVAAIAVLAIGPRLAKR